MLLSHVYALKVIGKCYCSLRSIYDSLAVLHYVDFVGLFEIKDLRNLLDPILMIRRNLTSENSSGIGIGLSVILSIAWY
jgi:hypothetical protein